MPGPSARHDVDDHIVAADGRPGFAQNFWTGFKSLGWLPAYRSIAGLRASELPGELAAGLSVAAVAIPVALAYSRIVGVPTEVGLYATIVGGLAYAIFGASSRFLIVGPDSATCLVLAAAITTLGHHDPVERAAIGACLTLLTGLALLCAGILRLGFVASLISKPILVGYLTGVSVTLAISQLPSITHVSLSEPGVLRPIIELARHQPEIHWPSVFVGLGTFAGLRAMKRLTPRIPGPAVAVLAAIVMSWAFSLRTMGFATIGKVPAGLPSLDVPAMVGDSAQLAYSTVGLVIVSFSSGILAVRAFGEHLGVSNNPNRELAGFGAANLAAGLFHGFTVTGASSRTAINLSAGGQSSLVGVVAAAAVAIVVTALAAPLSFLPEAVLGAILLSAARDLFDVKAFRKLARIDRSELVFALIATAGVIWIGVLQGIFLAVLLTFIHLLQLAARPIPLLVGRDPSTGHLVTVHRCQDAVQPEGVVVFLFEGSMFFLNADWFRKSVEDALRARPDARWLVLDATAMMYADSGTADALVSLNSTLKAQGIQMLIGGGHGRFRQVLYRSGFVDAIGSDRILDSPELALQSAEALRDAS